MTHIWIRAEERPNEQRVGVTPDGVAELLRAGFQVTLEEDPTRAIPLADYNGWKYSDGNILAASFNNNGRLVEAFRFIDSDGDVGYYDPEGVSMRKAFLKAPLDFTRVSSSFNPNRLHPIYKTKRPHRGTDYAAPRGTPVYAAGDGRVIEAGYSRANGNYIFIQHGEAFKTHYLHLNKKRVAKGSRVKQGQVPFTRTVADNALMMTAMASHDAKDSTSTQTPLQDLIGAVGDGVKGMKIGVPKEYVMDGMDSEVVTLWEQGQAWLRDAGAELIDVSLPHTKYALPAYYIIAPAEASSNLARYDGVRYGMRVDAETLDGMYEATRAAGFGEEVQRRIMIGTYVLSAGYYDAYYLKAQKVRRLIKGDFDVAFQTVDALLTPATPSAAFPVGRKIDDPVTNFLNDVFTVPANLAGLPGIAVPGGVTSDGLPLGLQVLGRPFDEASLYRVAGVLEQAAGFTTTPARMAGGAA